MKIGIPKEIYPQEKRVAVTPDVVKDILKLGFDIYIEELDYKQTLMTRPMKLLALKLYLLMPSGKIQRSY
jgi:hypothetical protein